MNTSEVDAQTVFHLAVWKFTEEKPSRKTTPRLWVKMERY